MKSRIISYRYFSVIFAEISSSGTGAAACRTVHENLKLHRCPSCSRTFSQSSSLYRHIRTAHAASSLGYEAPVGDV